MTSWKMAEVMSCFLDKRQSEMPPTCFPFTFTRLRPRCGRTESWSRLFFSDVISRYSRWMSGIIFWWRFQIFYEIVSPFLTNAVLITHFTVSIMNVLTDSLILFLILHHRKWYSSESAIMIWHEDPAYSMDCFYTSSTSSFRQTTTN